ncbi:MAG: FAD-binding oxidoreductase [Dehalococcoidia bacterium]
MLQAERGYVFAAARDRRIVSRLPLGYTDAMAHSTDTQALVEALAAIVGPEAVSTDEESRERLSFDAITGRRLMAKGHLVEQRVDVAVRPAGTQQVADIVRLADRLGLPVVPYGGGSGVMGAVIPVRGGIALDLRGMNRILGIDRVERLARVQPGVVLADLETEAFKHGLVLGHDPWSVPIATVGGAVSTDSVGYRAAKYGSMGQQVRAYEAVLGDGTVVRTRPLARQSGGPMLDRVVAGAEGAMGVLTEITLQLFPEPELRQFATFGFPSFEAGFPVTVRLYDMGMTPSLMDLAEDDTAEEAADYPCLLHLAFEGYREGVTAQMARAAAEALAAGGVDLGPLPTERHWEERHAVAERWRDRVRPLRPTERWKEQRWRSADYLHVSLPISRVVEYHRFAVDLAARGGFKLGDTGIWTDPRLYAVFIYDPDPAHSELARPPLWDAVDALLEKALELDGGVEYCHGIGSKLLDWAERDWGEALELARRLKRAVDPNLVLNPGKLGLS